MAVRKEIERVLVFGFSENSERYSNKAFHLLTDFNHKVETFNPRVDSTDKVTGDFDSVTMYVSPTISDKFEELLLSIKAKRFIFNPGSENPRLMKILTENGVEVVEGCTLVMLRTDQF